MDSIGELIRQTRDRVTVLDAIDIRQWRWPSAVAAPLNRG